MKVSSIESCCLAASQLHDVLNIAFRIVKLINRFSHWKWQIFTDIYILLSVRGIRMTLLWWYAGRYLAIYLHIILVHLNRLWFIWFTFHRLSISLKKKKKRKILSFILIRNSQNRVIKPKNAIQRRTTFLHHFNFDLNWRAFKCSQDLYITFRTMGCLHN